MSEVKNAIIFQSELNTWIDICIVPYSDFEQVKGVAEKAYDDWFNDDTAEPIGDYIKRKLDEKELSYEMYYSEEEEVE